MAGYVITLEHDPNVQFHHGEEGLIQKIVAAANSPQVHLLLDGDELAATLWGLSEYGKDSAKYREHSMKLNSIGWKLAVALGRIPSGEHSYNGDVDELVETIIAIAEPRIPKEESELVSGRDGVWLAYHHDWSAALVFLDEIEALRIAVEHGMQVRFWQYNTENPK